MTFIRILLAWTAVSAAVSPVVGACLAIARPAAGPVGNPSLVPAVRR